MHSKWSHVAAGAAAEDEADNELASDDEVKRFEQLQKGVARSRLHDEDAKKCGQYEEPMVVYVSAKRSGMGSLEWW